jgi:hypothetical protein
VHWWPVAGRRLCTHQAGGVRQGLKTSQSQLNRLLGNFLKKCFLYCYKFLEKIGKRKIYFISKNKENL